MQIILLGTEHVLQRDPDFKAVVLDIIGRYHVTLIAEENRATVETVATQLAPSLGIRWIQIDMSLADRDKAGIREKLSNRMQLRFDANREMYIPLRYAPDEDGIREEF